MRKHLKVLPHYLVLIAVLAAELTGFVLFSFDRGLQIGIGLALAIFYALWGIIHHHLNKDLYLAVVLEYLIIAFLGLVIIFSLIVRS